MSRIEFPRKIRAAIIARAAGKCAVEGCTKPPARRGLCHAHYQRLRTNGDVGSPVVGEVGKTMRFINEVAVPYTKDDCLLWPFAKGGSGSGHLRIKGVDLVAHRLVCERVHGPPPTSRHEAAHSCGKGHLGCVAPRHLRWATPKENAADKLQHGTLIRGSEHKSSKLTETAVADIRRCRENGVPLNDLARQYGVSISLISMIHSRKVWAWLDVE